jgi:hypothetical protein
MTEQVIEQPRPAAGGAWSGHLRAMDRALARSDADGALRAWEQAHLAAVESLTWEGLIAAGEAYLRVGQATRASQAAEAVARRAYFAALYRACRENSLDGVLRAAAAFAALDDHDVVDECLGLAELLAGDDEGRRHLAALSARLRHPGASGSRPDLP